VPAEEEKVVLVADPIDPSAVERLRAAGLTVVDATAGVEDVRSKLPRAWALVVRSRTKVTRDLLDHAPRLRLVARAGVGVDNVDVAAATERGISVTNVPAAATASVAELTVAFCLLLVRDLPARIASTRQGTWGLARPFCALPERGPATEPSTGAGVAQALLPVSKSPPVTVPAPLPTVYHIQAGTKTTLVWATASHHSSPDAAGSETP
jgi:lactate dehydrogenase-like 2-hydroxyacid dehydrogenase